MCWVGGARTQRLPRAERDWNNLSRRVLLLLERGQSRFQGRSHLMVLLQGGPRPSASILDHHGFLLSLLQCHFLSLSRLGVAAVSILFQVALRVLNCGGARPHITTVACCHGSGAHRSLWVTSRRWLAVEATRLLGDLMVICGKRAILLCEHLRGSWCVIILESRGKLVLLLATSRARPYLIAPSYHTACARLDLLLPSDCFHLDVGLRRSGLVVYYSRIIASLAPFSDRG